MRTLPPPPSALTAAEFVALLEAHGAKFTWRDADRWLLDLNGVEDLPHDEAQNIAEAAFDIRDAIRAHLLTRETKY
jgi:hypothetical protein